MKSKIPLREIRNATSHLFFCKNDSCCKAKAGKQAWKTLRIETKRRNKASTAAQLLRSTVDFLRICSNGPIAVLYPAGIWFHSMSEGNVRRVIDWIYDGKGNVDDLVFEVSCRRNNSD